MEFSQARVRMVDSQVRTVDVTDAAILDAMLAIPRELFVGAEWRGLAYSDENIRLTPQGAAPARYLMAPSPFAKLVQLAEIDPGDRILDIGCGSGYGAAVLSLLGASVTALESDAALAALAAENLKSLNRGNAAVVAGALEMGHAAGAPYDAILLEGSADRVPETLLGQLADGGRLVAVEGTGNAGRARVYLRTQSAIAVRNAFNAAIKPLPGFETTPTFQF